jgi:pyridoxine 5-phosphate synthase
MIRLGVNVDHVATIRQARGTRYPDPLEAAKLAIEGGADQITIHLREDRRHIQDADLFRMRRGLQAQLNLEMAAAEEMAAIACEVKPDTATLVPERREELTTEGGLAVAFPAKALAPVIARLADRGIRVSLFIDPDIREVEASAALGAAAVELHTGAYCDAAEASARSQELARLQQVARRGKELGLTVCAGHGINYENARALARALPEVVEYNVGHAIVARALAVGMAQAVRDMRTLLSAEVA